MYKFLHLMGGTTFFGIIIAMFFYISHSIQNRDKALIQYSLKASYFGDGVIFIIAALQFLTAVQLVSDGHFTLAIPWIFVAYHAFGTVILLWLSLLLIKIIFLSKTNILPMAIKLFYLLNTFIILIFIIIIHDAVTQSTWFDFLLRK